MSNELVKLVAKKANINETVASIAVETVVKALKDKLPQAVGVSLNSFLGSTSATNIAKTVAKTTAKAKPVAKLATNKSTKKDDPLGGLGDLVGSALGGLLGKK